jgi:hypothetical protein
MELLSRRICPPRWRQKIVTLPTPASARGRWKINIQVANINLSAFTTNPIALVLNDAEGDAHSVFQRQCADRQRHRQAASWGASDSTLNSRFDFVKFYRQYFAVRGGHAEYATA